MKIFYIPLFLGLILWHLKKLTDHLRKNRKDKRWSYIFTIIIRISWIIISLTGLYNITQVSNELFKMGIFVGSGCTLIAFLGIAQVHISALGHLKWRQPLITSFALPQTGGGDPRVKFHKGYHSGKPSLVKSIINMLVFLILVLSTCLSLLYQPMLVIAPFFVYGLLYFLSFLFKTDLFVVSDRDSDYAL
jgi:hypothetical protein